MSERSTCTQSILVFSPVECDSTLIESYLILLVLLVDKRGDLSIKYLYFR